ncbi:hypothetical protein F4819DRAFT_441262 [Hypoxylon fuscum]|nr:hypothetical protein F4819DRAFT_441262 [Hypoxylon fuscum]
MLRECFYIYPGISTPFSVSGMLISVPLHQAIMIVLPIGRPTLLVRLLLKIRNRNREHPLVGRYSS